MDIVVLGIDRGNNVCSLAGLNAEGRIVLRWRIKRATQPELLRPYPSDEMRAYRVSTAVNSVKNDGPECLEPAG